MKIPPSLEGAAMSLLAMYRMVGLRNALLYLRDTLQDMLPLVRINAILCSPDGDMVISVADTSLKHYGQGHKRQTVKRAADNK